MEQLVADLSARFHAGGEVEFRRDGSWRLSIPSGEAGQYRLAQLDDYSPLRREDFLWRRPLLLKLRARCSDSNLPGTWGFGLWNDPFSARLGIAGSTRRLPVLPSAAWFFFASPENFLSLDDRLPASGELAAAFQSRNIPSLMLLLAAPLAPLLFIRPAARLLRGIGRRFIQQDAANIPQPAGGTTIPATEWRDYSIQLTTSGTIFRVDEETVLQTRISPSVPLGLVIWIDNQFAALPPEGGAAYGTLPNPEPAWIEIAGLTISRE